jgi:hypothetical protein
LSRSDFAALFLDVDKDAINQTFAVFDSKSNSRVDSCEILATLILAAAQLSQETKLRGGFLSAFILPTALTH